MIGEKETRKGFAANGWDLCGKSFCGRRHERNVIIKSNLEKDETLLNLKMEEKKTNKCRKTFKTSEITIKNAENQKFLSYNVRRQGV